MTTICIDVGHGGSDSGAVSKSTGMLEKKINLNVALKLKEYLLAYGFKVVITRETDVYLSFTERGKISNYGRADLMVCIHHNAGGGHGFDLIHNLSKPLSKQACIEIEKEFLKLGQTKHRVFGRENPKTKGADYYGIMTATMAPVVITEFAFLDTDDVKEIDTLTEQWAEAKAIANGLAALFGKQVCPTCGKPR